MSFSRAFLAGMQAREARDRRKEEEEKKAALAEISAAKAEESVGYTADDGAALEAAAKSGQYIIGTKTNEDGTFAGYTVTPKADPTQTGTIAMQGVTDFMGTRTAGSMTEGQVNGARERAMAGVFMKQDPVKGMRMMREVTQGEREDKRFGWEQARNEREQRVAGEQDAEKAFMTDLDARVGDWMKTRVTGPDGAPREMTMDDHLAGSQFRAAQLVQAGKMDAAGQVMKEYNAQAFAKINLDTAQRNEALGKAAGALANGDFSQVKDFYNRFTPDGAQVTNITRGKNGEIVIERTTDDGQALPPTTMKDTGQILAALSTFKDPMALYNWSQNEFKNNMAVKANQRADRADARAGAAADRAASNEGQANKDKQARVDAGVALFKERNPNATAAELAGVRAGILDAVPKASGIDSDYKPDSFGSSGTVTQRDKNGNVVITKINDKGQPGTPITIGPPGRAAAPGATGAPPKINTQAELQKLERGARYVAPDGSIRIKQ